MPPMNRILQAFADHRAGGGKVLLPFITAGYPSLQVTGELLPALAQAGGGVIEVGIPFSDPIADGPVIAASMHHALGEGCTPEGVFRTVAAVRSKVEAPLVAMVSHSIVQRMGVKSFAEQAAGAGFAGLIVPDIDLVDAPALRAACDGAGLALTLLVAPTSGPDRVVRIAEQCSGFVYALARTGVTGEQTQAPDARAVVERIRAHTALPVAVGFGVSTAEHVRGLCQYADGVIVGSSLVRRIQEAVAAGRDPVETTTAFVRQMAAGTR